MLNNIKINENIKKINWSARFTGVATVKPLIFNPTKEQIAEIKEISPEKVYDVNYYNKDGYSGEKESEISVLCVFNPNEQVKEAPKVAFPEKVYINVSFRIQDQERSFKVKDKDSGEETGEIKYMWIDDKLNTLTGTSLDEAIASSKYSSNFNKDKARKLLVGEKELYDLLLAMSGIYKSAIESGFLLGETPEEATKVFQDMVNGDIDILNNLKETGAFSVDGEFKEIDIILGAAIGKTDASKVYQRHHIGLYDNWVSPGGTGISEKTRKYLMSKGHLSGSASFQDSFEFQVYDPTRSLDLDVQTDTEDVDVATDSLDDLDSLVAPF